MANSILNGETLNAIPFKSGKNKGLRYQHCTGDAKNCNKLKKHKV